MNIDTGPVERLRRIERATKELIHAINDEYAQGGYLLPPLDESKLGMGSAQHWRLRELQEAARQARMSYADSMFRAKETT